MYFWRTKFAKSTIEYCTCYSEGKTGDGIRRWLQSKCLTSICEDLKPAIRTSKCSMPFRFLIFEERAAALKAAANQSRAFSVPIGKALAGIAAGRLGVIENVQHNSLLFRAFWYIVEQTNFSYYAKDFVCVLCVVIKSLLFINKRLCYKLSNRQIY